MSQKQNINLEIAKIKNLPPLPEESIQIITAINDPDISLDQLVDVISLSPVLVARLLGLANSAFFGHAGQIKELRIAIIQVLGLDLVKSLVLGIVLNVEMDTSKCSLFDADYYWSHALVTAIVAQKLAVNINDELMLPGTVYTSGLLLNIGLLLAVHIFPSQVNEVFANSDRTNGSVSKKMRDYLGKTQYEMGAILLERWKLPATYQTIVKQFRQSDFEGKEKKLLLLLELSHWVGAYIVNNITDQTPDFSDLLTRLSLTKELLEKIVDEAANNKENIVNLARVISG